MITVIDYEPIQVFEGDGIDRFITQKTFSLFNHHIEVECEGYTYKDECAFLHKHLHKHLNILQIAHKPGPLQIIFETKYKEACGITNPKGYKIKEIWIKDMGIFKFCIVASVNKMIFNSDLFDDGAYKTTISFDYFMKA